MVEVETDFGPIELSEHDAKFVKYRGYRGDSLLKKAGVGIEWTPDLLAEYKRCADDPEYFIENHMKIVHIDQGLIPFKLRSYQHTLIDNIHNNRRNIVTMARQSGKSTAVIGYLLWFILFGEYKTAIILANKGATAREILGKAQLAYVHLPKFLQQGIVEWRKGSMTLENGSRAIAEATSSDTIRGYTANLLIIDECAIIERWEEFSTSVFPTITSGFTSKVVMISTPYGLNHFYAFWEGAKYWKVPPEDLPAGIKWNGYVPLLVTWKEVPDRDEKWHDEVLAEMNFNLEKFDQEYNCEFMGSSGTLIAGWKLKELVAQIPILQKNGLTKYEDVVAKHRYAITADVSEGKGLDYSTFHVSDVTKMPYKQVATFRSNTTTPGDFAEILFMTAKAYNNAMVLIEYENLGPLVASDIFNEYEYENIIWTKSNGRSGKVVTTRSEPTAEMGVKMTIVTKATGCSLLKLLIEQNQYIINDRQTIFELARFSRKGKSYEAEEGCNDDLVMALVVFAWLSNQEYFKEATEINTLQELRDKKTEQIEDELIPFGYFIREDPTPMPLTADLHKEVWTQVQMPKEYSPYRQRDWKDIDEEWMPNF